MLFQTKRLTVRKLATEDTGPLRAVFSDPQVMYFSIGGVLDTNEIQQHINENIEKYSHSPYCRWAIVENVSADIVGVCGLTRDTINNREVVHLNYRFSTANWGMGFATEVVCALVEYSRSLGLSTIHALIDPSNSASVKVVEKSGFSLQGDVQYKGVNVHMFRTCNPK